MNRVFVGLLLLIGGLLGLFMAACGGLFTIGGIGDSLRGGQAGAYASGMLVISVPSLAGGVLLLWFVKRRLAAFRASSPAGQFDPPHGPG